LYEDIITFRNFTNGIKVWSQNTDASDDIVVRGNIGFDNGEGSNIMIACGDFDINNSEVINNLSWREADDGQPSCRFGSNGDQYHDTDIVGNYCTIGERLAEGGALWLQSPGKGMIKDNVFIGQVLVGSYTQPISKTNILWQNNQFYAPPAERDPFWWDNQDGTYEQMGWDVWKAKVGQNNETLLDDTNLFMPELPTENYIVVHPNRYDENLAYIGIVNWKGEEFVKVEPLILDVGQNYAIYDVENIIGPPVAEGVYDGEPILIPMNLSEVAPIPGLPKENDHSSSQFGVFMLVAD
jgi:hypothetical protein